MKLIFLGYVTIGAIIGLICEVVIGYFHFKNGYDRLYEHIYSLKLGILILAYIIDIFTWPERVLSFIWWALFRKLTPWRQLMYDRIMDF